MGTKIVKWLADDGTEFGCEEDMLEHELCTHRLAEIELWLWRDPGLSEAARTRRRRTVMSFLHWQDLEDAGGEPPVAPDEDEIEAARR